LIQERSLLPPTDLKALGPEPAGLAIAACSGLRLHVQGLLRRQQAAMKPRKITVVLELAVAYETAFLAWHHHYLGDLELVVQDLVGLGPFRDPKSVKLRDVWSRAICGLPHVAEQTKGGTHELVFFYLRVAALFVQIGPSDSFWKDGGILKLEGGQTTTVVQYKRYYNEGQVDFEAGLGEFETPRRDVLDRVGERCANGNREV